MSFTDTRLGPGTLQLGIPAPGTEFGFQVSAITLTPSTDSTDGTPTLAVPEPAPETKTSYALEGSAINDFAAAAGLQRYAYENDGATVDFEWVSSTVAGAGATLTGQVVMRAFPMGGNVGEQLVTDFSWPCVGKPAFSDVAGDDGGETSRLETTAQGRRQGAGAK